LEEIILYFDYVLVQAGGRGSRMEILTRNKPKALVPVNNLPMIFHLFRKYPDKKFIVIGDYKFDVLARYLETFADVKYILTKSVGKGNVAGIKQALDFIPQGENFLLIWSDLILGENFSPENLGEGNYIGTTKNFSCSWSYFDGVLEKKTIDGHGVAGCFIFQDKKFLETLPTEGSFTRWLAAQNFELREMSMNDTVEIGTVESFKKNSSTGNRCRPYNKMTFDGDKVIKEALTDEAQKLLQAEIDWYEKISSRQSFGLPKIFSTKPLTMERINGNNIFSSNVADDRKKIIVKRMVDCLKSLHELDKSPANPFDMEKDYYQKTLARVRKIMPVIPFANDAFIKINGKNLKNPLVHLQDFHEMTALAQKDQTPFGIIHGDCTFSNTLLDDKDNIYLIDARGYFGNTKFVGDVDYDWAKMYYSIVAAFDQFNVKNFDLEITGGEVKFSIANSGWEQLEDYFFSLIERNPQRIKFIHSIIWLSLASHCWEDYDSMCLAFYNGVELWNEVLDEGAW